MNLTQQIIHKEIDGTDGCEEKEKKKDVEHPRFFHLLQNSPLVTYKKQKQTPAKKSYTLSLKVFS